MVGANLHLNPLALVRHQRNVQSLIAVGLRMIYPVAQTVGVRLVYLVDSHVYAEALVNLLRAKLRSVDYAHGEDVVYLVERNVLVLHLVPDRVGALYARLNLVLYAHTVERLAYGFGKGGEYLVALGLCVSQPCLDILILLRMLVAERKVLKFGLNLVQTKTVCKRSIYI